MVIQRNMKSIFYALAGTFFILLIAVSCQKEYSLSTTSTAKGWLISDATGQSARSVVNGLYTEDSSLSRNNYIDVQVNITTPGIYNIHTDTLNGYYFKRIGSTDTVGLNMVRLQGAGKPESAGVNTFHIKYDTSFSKVIVKVSGAHIPAPSPALFTLAGTPAACVSPVINGNYITGTALNASNTVVLKVNVISPGSYKLSTNTVNGIKFSASGVFSSQGLQSVTLTGTGTPTAGVATFEPMVENSSCTFDINIRSAPAARGTYSCKIDGVLTTFADGAEAVVRDRTGLPYLNLTGYSASANSSVLPEFKISVTNNNATPVGTGSYNVNGFVSTKGYKIDINYNSVNTDKSVVTWKTSSSIITSNPPFTINITSISDSRVKGTFSGKLKDISNGSRSKTITEGVFDLPIKG